MRVLYKILSIIGFLNSPRKGRYVARSYAHKQSTKLINRLFK